jgi:hypothetical protein
VLASDIEPILARAAERYDAYLALTEQVPA